MRLTPKEKKVLELVKKGLKQSEIAAALDISQPAVSIFYRNALKKIRAARKILEFVDELGLEVDDEE